MDAAGNEVVEEGVLVSHDRSSSRVAMRTSDGRTQHYWCGNGPRPIPPHPREPVVFYTEVFVPPPTRLDVYMGIGALLGLGVGLALAAESINQPSGCDDPYADCFDDPSSGGSGIEAIVMPILGAAVGGLIGLASEGSDAWLRVGVVGVHKRGEQAVLALNTRF